ncbi:MAG TPA: hypothetical protein VI248_14060, partial [Kineosporiaceae bacterium]
MSTLAGGSCAGSARRGRSASSARSPCWAACRRPRPLPGRLPHLPAPDSTPEWAPQYALPTPAHDGRQVDIVLSPHP